MIILTTNAHVDTFTDTDYRDMFDELREERSLRGLTRLIASMVENPVSHAAWAKYDADPSCLTRRMKNELRVASGQVSLPITVEEAIAGVDDNATVAVLDSVCTKIDFVLLGSQDDPFILRTLAVPMPPKRVRKKAARPVASVEQEARRERLGVKWREVIERGLANLEEEAGR